MRYGFLVALIVIVGLSTCANADPNAKKLIEYGWDNPTPEYVAAHVREMEKQPFDGVVINIPKMRNVFENRWWSVGEFQASNEALSRITWGSRLTDNFIAMNAGSELDWFSDADWARVLNNVERLAVAAKIGRCKGLTFDPEPYGKSNPWCYTDRLYREKSFAEYQTMVRKRGQQFMVRLQSVMPSVVLHSLFMSSNFVGDSESVKPYGDVYGDRKYGLLQAFLMGMLDKANPGTVIVDGNERSYDYLSPSDYYRGRKIMRSVVLGILPANLVPAYKQHVQCGHAVYTDRVFYLNGQPSVAQYMSPAERLQWYENNVYYALKTADEYVWVYSQHVDWWNNNKLPAGIAQAVVSAKRKVSNGKPLGFDIEPIIDNILSAKAGKQRSPKSPVLPIEQTKPRTSVGQKVR